MIITKLQGGLGNQMFQYAIGRNLTIRNNSTLKLDTDYYVNNKLFQYGLGHFNITENIASTDEIKKYYNKFNKILDLFLPFTRKKIIFEKNLNFDEGLLSLKDNHYLYGYWNNEKYFKNIRSELLQEFRIKQLSRDAQEILERINKNSSTAIHIRRGDYLTAKHSKIFASISLEYYKMAIKKIAAKDGNPFFYIFSDDIEWVKNEFKPDFPFELVSRHNLKNYEELYLMSRCKNNIIANSTFSWWGAWLNNNSDKIVIAPKKWYVKNTANDLIPEDWIKI
jgi:hypothetical protein